MDIVSPLLQWLNANPEWAGFATFLISAAESVAIVGTIVPGSITMTAIGALAGAGVIPLGETIFWAILGAVLGDGISYWMGYYFKDRLRRMWPFRDNPSILAKGEYFVHKHGVMSIFIGRFIGPVRALVPLVAGMLGMRPLQFTISNIASAIGWAPVYMLPGILLGAASLELPPDIAMHVVLTLLLGGLFILLCLWLIYKIFQLIHKQTSQALSQVWQWMQHSKRLHFLTTALKHHNPRYHHGQLTLAFYFLLMSILFIGLASYVHKVGANHIFLNDVVFHFFRSIRTTVVDQAMISITLLGQWQIVLPMVGVLFLWLFLAKRRRAALHVLALGLLAGIGVYVSKHLIQSLRPWGILHSPETYSMPSGHVTLATTVYLGIAFIIANPLRKRFRWLIYIPAILLVLLISLSRMYLSAHWFTDVLAGWLLGIALLLIMILSYNRQYEKPLNVLSISAVCFSTLAICYTAFYHYKFQQLKTNYTELGWPTVTVSTSVWWEKNNMFPVRVSLFGYPSQYINIQWVGSLKDIRATLLAEGWAPPPTRDWISTIHRMTGIESTAYLPMVSPQYLDQKPALILARRTNGSKKLLVLRLWQSNWQTSKTYTPIWVGTLGVVPKSYSWPFEKKHEIKLKAKMIFPLGNEFTNQWQWKLITTKYLSPTSEQRDILLIKSAKS